MPGLTAKERELLEVLTRCSKLKDAAQILGISPCTASQRLYRIRMKYAEAQKTVRVVERAILRMPTKFLEAAKD